MTKFLIWIIEASGYQRRWGPHYDSRAEAVRAIARSFPKARYWIEEISWDE